MEQNANDERKSGEQRSKWMGKVKDVKNLSPSKKVRYIGIFVIIAIILAIYFSTFTKESDEQNGSSASDQSTNVSTSMLQDDDLAVKMEQTIEHISGVKDANVLITYESSKELVPAFQTGTTTDTTQESSEGESKTTRSEDIQSEIATVDGEFGQNALILKEIEPEIKGVVVVAQGAEDIGVKMNIIQAVTTLLDIPQNKVEVFHMDADNEEETQ